MTPAELRTAIKALGLPDNQFGEPSGRALAELLGLPPRTIQHWLDGSREIPKPAILLIQAAIKFPAVAKWLKNAPSGE